MRVIGLLLLLAGSPAESKTIRQIELRGDARIYALDAPVRRGRVLLFHRYPDGVYMSVPAEDVLGIAATTVPREPKRPDTVMLGETGEGHPADRSSSSGVSERPPAEYDQGYSGYYGYGYWPCFGCGMPPNPSPGPTPPSRIGPNGFPLLPGSPPPPPIGPNGFPILNPPQPPPVPSPR